MKLERVCQRLWIRTLIVLVLTFILYWPALRGGFLWDDDLLLTDNPLIKAQDGFWRFWWTRETTDYYPVMFDSLWLEWRLWGMNPTGYHVTNLLLHALGVVLVWQILDRLKIPGAWLAALIFAVHPVNVESVAWIAERKNTLSLVFYGLTVLAFLRFERQGRYRWYWISVGLFLLGLLTKTSGVMMPLILLLLAWWQRGRIDFQDLRRSIPFFVLAATLGFVTVKFQQGSSTEPVAIQRAGPEQVLGAARQMDQRNLVFRLGAAGHVFWFYFFKVLAPFNLMTIYPLWKFDASSVWFYVPTLAVVGVFLGCWRYRRRWGRPLLFGIGYFSVMLFPVLGVFSMPYIGRSPVVTDHLQYLPMIGIAGLVAGVAAWAYEARQAAIRRMTVGIVVVIAGALCFQTWSRAGIYRNQETLWTDAIARNPEVPKAHYNLGVFLNKQGRLDSAIVHYNEALRLRPDYADAHNNLANVLVKTGQLEAALSHYAKAVRIRRQYPEAHRNWADTLLRMGRTDEAFTHYSEAVRLKPDDAEAQYNLGLILAGYRRFDDAVEHLTAAVRARPDYAEAHNNLGNALVGLGRFDEALAEYATAVRIKPDYAEAQYNWGLALARRGRMEEAIIHLTEAVRLDPDDAQAQNNLGVALASQGKLKEATVHFSEAVRLKPDDPDFRRNLQGARQTSVRP